jgi:golgi-specific brefeldin A-resistance guanine nucleotide exchange factor 1
MHFLPTQVNKDDSETTAQSSATSQSHAIMYHCKLLKHSPNSLVKCWDSLAFIVRNVAHITPYNFEDCVRCIRTFVEASFNGGKKNRKLRAKLAGAPRKGGKKDVNRKRNKTSANGGAGADSSDSEIEELPESYQTISVQVKNN